MRHALKYIILLNSPLHNNSNSSHACALLRRNHHDMLKESEYTDLSSWVRCGSSTERVPADC